MAVTPHSAALDDSVKLFGFVQDSVSCNALALSFVAALNHVFVISPASGAATRGGHQCAGR